MMANRLMKKAHVCENGNIYLAGVSLETSDKNDNRLSVRTKRRFVPMVESK